MRKPVLITLKTPVTEVRPPRGEFGMAIKQYNFIHNTSLANATFERLAYGYLLSVPGMYPVTLHDSNIEAVYWELGTTAEDVGQGGSGEGPSAPAKLPKK